MKVIAITQARTGSTRLPNKVLKEIGGKSLLQIHIERAIKAKKIDQLIVATTTSPQDHKICELSRQLGVDFYMGSEYDVLDRFYQAAQPFGPDYIVRLTSDCPLIDPLIIDSLVDLIISENVDYCSNVLIESFPDGQDVEVFTFHALERAWKEAALQSEREHVTPFIYNNSDFKGGTIFKALNYYSVTPTGQLRLTVDEQVDFEIISELIGKLGQHKNWEEYANYLMVHGIGKNSHIKRNEGYIKSLSKDNDESPV